ncbi:MAG: N-acetylmuramoyl-L-alanine amidase [Lachnospirales bacterium]
MIYNFIKKISIFSIIALFSLTNTSILFARINLIYDGTEHTYTEEPFSFYVDGKLLENLPVEPVRINDRFYVPVRAFFEELGAEVEWYPESQQILVINGIDIVLMQIDSLNYTVNSQEMTLNEGEAPKLVNYGGSDTASTMVPVRMVSEGLGFNVIYDGDNKIISINSNSDLPTTETPIEEIPATETPIAEVPATETPIVEVPATEIPVTETPVSDETTTSNSTFVLPKNKSENPLTSVTNPETSLTSVAYNEAAESNNYQESIVLSTTTAISSVSEILLPDGRLVLDFNNATFNISNPSLTVSDNSSFTATNGSQFQKTPTKIARFVMTLKSGVHYTLNLSEDRKSLTVTFLRGQLTNFNFENEVLTILGTKDFSVTTQVLTNPLRLVVDIPSMSIDTKNISGDYSLPVTSQTATNIRISQYSPTVARFVIDMSNDFYFNIQNITNGIKLTLTPSEYSPAYYSYSLNSFVIKKSSLSNTIALSDIQYTENVTYKTKEYIFNINATIPELTSLTSKNISTGMFDSYSYENVNGTSQLKIYLNKAKTFVITEDSSNIYFTPKSPGDVYDKVIVIDPGHGGTDPGTLLGDLKEKDVVLDIGLQVKEIVENSDENIKVYISREVDEMIPLFDIPVYTEEVNPDLFISIHVNSVEGNTTANGTETYYYTTQSSDFATVMQKNLLATMGTYDRKTKKAAFVVIRETDIPSILIETAFITNPSDNALLRSPEWRTNTAQGIVNGVVETFDTMN